jgi:dihydrofolate synthase/folylpolyglutamate synthase
MNFQQSLSYLEQIQSLGMKFGLENVRTILSSWRDPHLRYPSVIVAGSNGKGSVCAMLTRILSLHGFRVGLYTSPHLVSYQERIRIGERVISQADFSRVLTALKNRVGALIRAGKLSHPPTHFETLTCMALRYFQQKNVDMAVLEVGMGGRFDATNVVRPSVSVITTISFEHQRSLGSTLKSIAFEKAGIIKPGVPVICGVESSSPRKVIRAQAAEQKAPLIQVFDRERGKQLTVCDNKGCFSYQGEEGTYVYKPSLPGVHQGRNAAVAVAACEELGRRWKKLEKKRIIRGIETTRWEGRLEVYARDPLVILDGAHNIEGAKALRSYVLSLRQKPVVIVFATMADKKIGQLADILFPLADRIFLTRFPYHRAAYPEEMARRLPGFLEKIRVEPDVLKAMGLAHRSAGKRGAVLVTGSLFLVGEVKKLIPRKS